MNSLTIRLFSSIVLVILCADITVQEFGDWFSDNKDENNVDSGDSSDKSSIAQTFSSATSETTLSSSSSVSSLQTSSTPEPISTSTSWPTSSPTTPSTPSTRTPSTSSTVPSTRPTRRPFTWPTIPPVFIPSSAQPITSPQMPSTEDTPELSSHKPKQCLEIKLNAKITFNYESNDGIDQQFEIIGGNTNGELIQSDKCQPNQTLTIKYDLVESTQLIIWISITDTDINIKSIRFEYPFLRLPDDFNKENHSEEVQTCSKTTDKCLIAQNNDLIKYSFKYKINEQIYCKELPQIVSKNNKTFIDILFKDFRLVVTDGQTGADLNRGDEFCPIDTINGADNQFDAMFAESAKIWIGVSYAVVGALIMFGFAFIYEKFVRERLLYNPIDREEPVA